MSDFEEGSLKLRDMDVFLKDKIVELWEKAITFYIDGDAHKSFKAYKSLFYFVESYNFPNKGYLVELVSTIQDYIDALGEKPLTMSSVVVVNQRRRVFKELIDEFMREIPRAYKDLGLWLKSVPDYNDFELKFSEESFGDELSLVQDKKKELSKLKSSELLELFSFNAIHDAYAKHLHRVV